MHLHHVKRYPVADILVKGNYISSSSRKIEMVLIYMLIGVPETNRNGIFSFCFVHHHFKWIFLFGI